MTRFRTESLPHGPGAEARSCPDGRILFRWTSALLPTLARAYVICSSMNFDRFIGSLRVSGANW